MGRGVALLLEGKDGGGWELEAEEEGRDCFVRKRGGELSRGRKREEREREERESSPSSKEEI